MPSPDLPTSIRLAPDLKRALKREADKRRWGVSELVQEILKQWFTWQKKREEKK